MSTAETFATPSVDPQLRITDGAAVLLSLAQRRRAWLESLGQRAAGEGVPALDEGCPKTLRAGCALGAPGMITLAAFR